MDEPQDKSRTALRRRRDLRARSTKAESLLWQVLRSRRLGGLKFRRQHSIGPFIVDFACLEKRVVVELDGDYHDAIFEKDQHRQGWLENDGWQVLRFRNDDVLDNVEAVAIAIGRRIGIELDFGGGGVSDSPSP
jgi:very-short-patch-repair endonuclease